MNARLKLFLPLLLFLVLATIFLALQQRMGDGSYTPSELPSALLGKSLPSFALPALDDPDRLVEAPDLLGEPALLNVWATWCVACRAEHPYLNYLANRGVVIFGLNYKDERAAALGWLERLGDPYRLSLFDEAGKLGLDLGVYGAPETFVLDAGGKIVYRHVGVLDERTWRNRIERLALWPAGTGSALQ
ncbi:MAG: DsbE family thiol:disulfide interchange protein [Pseudomonadales bacterium]